MAAPKGHKRYGGRQKGVKNKATVDIKEALAPYGDQLIEGLVQLTQSADLPIRLKATETALAYIHGKPKQSSDINLTGSISIAQQIAEARARAGSRAANPSK
jgi:hypothetical protein